MPGKLRQLVIWLRQEYSGVLTCRYANRRRKRFDQKDGLLTISLPEDPDTEQRLMAGRLSCTFWFIWSETKFTWDHIEDLLA